MLLHLARSVFHVFSSSTRRFYGHYLTVFKKIFSQLETYAPKDRANENQQLRNNLKATSI